MRDLEDILSVLEEIKNLAKHSMGMKLRPMPHEAHEGIPIDLKNTSIADSTGDIVQPEEEEEEEEEMMPENGKSKKIIMIESSKKPFMR